MQIFPVFLRMKMDFVMLCDVGSGREVDSYFYWNGMGLEVD